MAKRNSLGKGLDALFIDNNTEDGAVTTLKVADIEPNKDQPRTIFNEEALSELADSVRNHGVIQPLVVRPLEKGGYQIVAGERRWRAARRAGLTEVPVVIRDLEESQVLEIAIIENLQREDLTVVELAQGYQALMKQYGMTQEQVAAKVGKSRSAVANTVRLLALPQEVLRSVSAGTISAGHAKALLSLEDPELILETARRLEKSGMLVRDIEKLARSRRDGAPLPKQERSPEDLHWQREGAVLLEELRLALERELSREVRVKRRRDRFTLELDFYDEEELRVLAYDLLRLDEMSEKGKDDE